MDNNFNVTPKTDEVKENVLAGIVGAFVFGLAGGVLWFVLYLVGFFSGLSGLVGVVCAIKGYAIFSKKESTKGIIIATVMALLVLVLAWYLCFAYDIQAAYQIWYEDGEIDFTLTYAESIRAVPIFLSDPEVGTSYLINLAIGLLLGVVGAGSYVYGKIKGNKKPTPSTTAVPENMGNSSVVLTECGDNKLELIKAVREITYLGLKESKDIVESLPQTIKAGISEEEARRIIGVIEAAGGSAEIR
jgi:ribosomal protein L7/L12